MTFTTSKYRDKDATKPVEHCCSIAVFEACLTAYFGLQIKSGQTSSTDGRRFIPLQGSPPQISKKRKRSAGISSWKAHDGLGTGRPLAPPYRTSCLLPPRQQQLVVYNLHTRYNVTIVITPKRESFDTNLHSTYLTYSVFRLRYWEFSVLIGWGVRDPSRKRCARDARVFCK